MNKNVKIKIKNGEKIKMLLEDTENYIIATDNGIALVGKAPQLLTHWSGIAMRILKDNVTNINILKVNFQMILDQHENKELFLERIENGYYEKMLNDMLKDNNVKKTKKDKNGTKKKESH